MIVSPSVTMIVGAALKAGYGYGIVDVITIIFIIPPFPYFFSVILALTSVYPSGGPNCILSMTL